VAVGALADGELDLLPETALCHAEACPTCGERVGRAAVALAEALAAAAPGAPPHGAGSPVPRPARG
jgi:anti-sigma factor ChrR (cupin superfamily)